MHSTVAKVTAIFESTFIILVIKVNAITSTFPCRRDTIIKI